MTVETAITGPVTGIWIGDVADMASSPIKVIVTLTSVMPSHVSRYLIEIVS